MKPHIHKLQNGLSIIFIDIKAFPSLTTILLVGAGSRFENKKNNGIAHFFEHMAFKGSKKYPNSLVIASTIEGLGGVFNAFTAKDHTGYWIKALNEHFDKVVDVMSDMILHPFLLPEEIEREKGVIAQEINMYEDNPQRKVGEVFESLLYQGNPLGFDITGAKETVKTFNKRTFTDYMGNLYHPKNAVLVVAGDLRHRRDYLHIVEEKFLDWKDGEKSTFKKVKEKQKKPEVLLKYKRTEQAHFCLGFRAFSLFDSRQYPLSVLAALLGGGMSSRLFIEIRERRGLCYYISTGKELYQDAGNLVTQAGVTTQSDQVKQTIELILKEHQKIRRGEVKKEELTRVKELLKGRLILSLEDSLNVAFFHGIKFILENAIKTPNEVIAEIEKVTIDDIVRVSSDIFTPEKLNLAIIGPFKKKEEFESVLSI